MFHIKKGKEPKKLATHKSGGGSYDDFSLDKGKREVKGQLLKEQHNLCAYCTASINFDETNNFDNMKIEHWLPQNNKYYPKYKEYELQYRNMLAVCKGCILYNGKTFYHCDHSKAKGDEVIEINPLEQPHIEQLSYTKSTGILKSSNSSHQREIDTILNLNILPLRRERKKQLQNFKIGLSKKYKDKTANYAKELNKFSAKKMLSLPSLFGI